jgi:hypothetical protein
MFDWITARVLRLVKVPHRPEPPLGAPGSVRIFRAGENQFRLRVFGWLVGQSGALIGIVFSLLFLAAFETGVRGAQRALEAGGSPSPSVSPTPSPEAAGAPSPSATRSRAERRRDREQVMRTVVARTPGWVVPLIRVVELFGIAGFALQLLVTYAIVRLEFEQHWYIVTDRSLRIRTGILRLQESTMSFANIQQVEIRQGPLQRFLGLADVCVRSAGGSDPQPGAKGHAPGESLHLGVFAGVANAVEIRDLVLERLRRFREAGLGDPDDAQPEPHPTDVTALAEAARMVLSETRSLSRVLRLGT